MPVTFNTTAQHRALRQLLEDLDHTPSRARMAGGLGLPARGGAPPKQTDSTGGPSTLIFRRHGDELGLRKPTSQAQSTVQLADGLYRQTRANGDTYLGALSAGQPFGRGMLIHNGITYQGFFFKGKRTGDFVVTIADIPFKAKFTNDLQIGPLQEAPELMSEASSDAPSYSSFEVRGEHAPETTVFTSRELNSAGSSVQGTPVEEQAPAVFFVQTPESEQRPESTSPMASPNIEVSAADVLGTPNTAPQFSAPQFTAPVERPEWDFSTAPSRDVPGVPSEGTSRAEATVEVRQPWQRDVHEMAPIPEEPVVSTFVNQRAKSEKNEAILLTVETLLLDT